MLNRRSPVHQFKKMKKSPNAEFEEDEEQSNPETNTDLSLSTTPQKRKRDKIQENTNETSTKKPSSIISLFTAQDGTRTGPPVELPISSTSKQLDILINTLLENTEPVLFSLFYLTVLAPLCLLCQRYGSFNLS